MFDFFIRQSYELYMDIPNFLCINVVNKKQIKLGYIKYNV